MSPDTTIDEVIILIAWHQEADEKKIKAFEANKQTFIDHNPGVKIFTVISPFKDPRQAWLNTDLSLFRWYLNNKAAANSKRYVIVEWDCWCNCSVYDYFQKVWDDDLVVPSVKYPERDAWEWFFQIRNLPIPVRPYAVGITPMCGLLVSQRAFEAIGTESLKPEYYRLNSELRLGTIATMLNYDPIVNPVYSRSINWKTPLFGLKYKGFHHPRKLLQEGN